MPHACPWQSLRLPQSVDPHLFLQEHSFQLNLQSALALFMLGVTADDHHFAFAFDHTAFFADGFNRRSDFHNALLSPKIRKNNMK